MLVFDPKDPFPLLPEGSHTYAEAQAHSARVDDWLGLRTEATERGIALAQPADSPHQLWVGLPVKAMLTPYTEIRRMLELLAPPPGSTVVDLGAGYGRMGQVIGRHWPEVRFIGYELAEARVIEGRRCLAHEHGRRVRLVHADLSAPGFAPEPAEFHFIYDYGTRDAIEKTLQDLRALARARPITVVGRGRATRDAIERRHPWLSGIVDPGHHGNFSIYRTRS